MTPTPWTKLAAPRSEEGRAARLALHFAAQPMAAAAYALVPARDDHSHSNLLWSPERGGFVGRELPTGGRCFLDPRALRTGVLSADGRTLGEVEVVGRTLDQVFGDLTAALRESGAAVPSTGLKLPDYDLPESPLLTGGRFEAPVHDALDGLGDWFGNAAATLAHLSAAHLGGAEVRGWPHHFDLAALRTIDPDQDAEHARSLGVGFSPGDDSYPEPYFYVSPWPTPARRDLASLPPGAHWHTLGFTSAILPAEAIVTSESIEAQRTLTERTLDTILRSCLLLLES